MKFDQLIECNMKNIFLEISCITCGGETSHRPFCEKLKLSISLDQQFKVLYSLLFLYDKLRSIETYRNYAADHLLSLHIKLFQKIKRGLKLVSLPHFPHKKYFSCYILLIDQIAQSDCLYFVRYLAICVSQWHVNQFVTSWILQSKSSRFTQMTKKAVTKT